MSEHARFGESPHTTNLKRGTVPRPVCVTIVGAYAIISCTYYIMILGTQFVFGPSSALFFGILAEGALVWVAVLVLRGSMIARRVFIGASAVAAIVSVWQIIHSRPVSTTPLSVMVMIIGAVPFMALLYLPSSNEFFAAESDVDWQPRRKPLDHNEGSPRKHRRSQDGTGRTAPAASWRTWPVATLAAAIGVALAVVVALIAARPSPSLGVAGAPDLMTQPVIGPYVERAGLYATVLDPQVGQIAIAHSPSDRRYKDGDVFKGIDLGQHKIRWSVTVPGVLAAFATAGYFVYSTGGQLAVRKAINGKTVATVPLDSNERLIDAQSGIALTVKNGVDICARSLANPRQCLWQANAVWTGSPATIFGGGAWVNTGDGVLDLLTGQPGTFGADVTHSAKLDVHYLGPTRDRVLRYEQDNTGEPRLQVWDAQNNRAIGEPMPGSSAIADASNQSFVTVAVHHNEVTQVAGHTWEGGPAKWQTNLHGDTLVSAALCGDALVATTSTIIAGMGIDSSNATVIDLGSGTVVQFKENGSVIAGNSVAYIGANIYDADDGGLTAYSCSSPSFQKLWTIHGPSFGAMYGIGGRLLVVLSWGFAGGGTAVISEPTP